MSSLRLLNAQGMAGLAASLCLAILLGVAKFEARHWKSESSRFEQLYRAEQAGLATTVANYRAAADAARAADQANAERVTAEQRDINERTTRDYQTRIAAARARADQLRLGAQAAAADPRRGASAAVPLVPAASCGSPQDAGEDRLPASDALTATEQAIQLDELIAWVKRQAAVDPNASAAH